MSRAQPGGTGTSKLLDDEILGIRDYLNDGGKALVAGKFALQGGWDQFLFNPLGAPPAPFCKSNQVDPSGNDDPAGQLFNCVAVSNDFQQYWLGAYLPIGAAVGNDAAAALPFQEVGRALRQRGIHGQRRGLRGQSGQHLLVPDDVEHPAGRHLPAVREPAGDQDRPPAVVRPADGHALRVLAGGRRQLQAAVADGRPDREDDGRPVVHGVLRHRARLGLPHRRGPYGRPGRLDDAPRRERAHHERHHGQQQLPADPDRRGAPVHGALRDAAPRDQSRGGRRDV